MSDTIDVIFNDIKYNVKKSFIRFSSPGLYKIIASKYKAKSIEITDDITESTFITFLNSMTGKEIFIDFPHAYEIQYMAEKYENKLLLEKVNNFIENIPNNYRVLYHLLFLTKMQLNTEEAENYFASHFDDCVLPAYNLNINPEYIIQYIMKNPYFHSENGHNIVQYIIKANLLPDLANEALTSNIGSLSKSDINDLLNFNNDLFLPSVSYENVSCNDILQFVDGKINHISNALEDQKNNIENAVNDIDQLYQSVFNDDPHFIQKDNIYNQEFARQKAMYLRAGFDFDKMYQKAKDELAEYDKLYSSNESEDPNQMNHESYNIENNQYENDNDSDNEI
ncbi:hypothetical protein TRFO_21909 [Tritrichomonas foetus]|uniref:BTB domain-containing protein n=1 Tax=Tritrichomonas foetus TaxID=1144522 RepID=A0A1J4KE27_9EUKA|nr:hypothetical protein TRFO_21909 [Tritrichomonas foetus]|eukprot:OHT09258.1 hypothetical protein TRFO_21909 [Tritrichomonas foetus]